MIASGGGYIALISYTELMLLYATANAGAQYGMSLHWSKFQLISVGRSYSLSTPSGEPIPSADAMHYLGVDIRPDGSAKGDLHRRSGGARGEFCHLNRFWKHTQLTTARKLEVFEAVIVSRLLHGLNSAWINVAEIRKLNGFYCRCLRVIQRIQPAFISRVSNEAVLARAGRQPISQKLLRRQLLAYGRVVRASEHDVLKSRTF